MHVRIWSYEVRPDEAAEFVRVYGASGAWATLFGRSEGFLGCDLYHDPGGVGYLTVDRWESEPCWEDFRRAHGQDYAALDARTARLTSSESLVFVGDSVPADG